MRLEFNGLKAADRSVELGKLNLFRGPVGSGKSSCLDALRFLALGYVPQNGKLPELTGRLMRGTEIGARLSLDGRTLERRLICEQVKGVTRYRAEAIDSAHSPKAKATEHSERIRGLFGSSDAEAAENLDLRALLSLSGNERAKKVQALLANTSGMSVDEIMSIVGPLAVCRVAEYPEAKLPTDATALAGLAAGFLVRPPSKRIPPCSRLPYSRRSKPPSSVRGSPTSASATRSMPCWRGARLVDVL